jgi:hypothetical protein
MNAVSEEQQQVITHIHKGNNVIVDACAGSGKSTTVLSTALSQPHRQFLLITYNKSLRKEIQEKVRELQITNIVVHTYHSLAVAIYDPQAHVDKVMRLLVQANKSPNRLIHSDVIVLDEVQDMTFLYFRLIVKYIRDVNQHIQLMILGDFMQGLYEFKGADIRFLTKASDIWRGFQLLSSQTFQECSLKTSYRITNPMADFVNDILIGEKRLKACREVEPVVYIRRRIHELERFVVTTIRDLLQEDNAKPSDFFILGGSVKGANSVIRRIENALVDANIPCHVPMMENAENMEEDVIKGKIVFSSFHTSKGRQRPYVFVVGFDHSYFKTVARGLDPTKCPNTIYVATTRASKRLYVLESDEWSSDRPFKFLKATHNELRTKSYIDFRGIPRSKFEDECEEKMDKQNECHKVNPTDLTKFLSETVLEIVTPLLDRIFIKEKEEDILLMPSTIQTRSGLIEDVSDLNGIAIPAMLYDYIYSLYDNHETGILYRMIRENLANTKPNKHLFLKNQPLVTECENVGDYLYMANVLEACQEKLYFKLKQIQRDEYNWLTPELLKKCKSRMMKVLQKDIEEDDDVLMEEPIVSYEDEYENEQLNSTLNPFFENHSFRFSARVDLLTSETLWELKCTSEITVEHLIQTVLYAWIWRTIHKDGEKEIKIFNIRSGQVLRLEATDAQLTHIVVVLLKGKYEKEPPLPEGDFINECRRIL